jgi:GDP-4-dehydro-6-deoxy-D-mannose reductase
MQTAFITGIGGFGGSHLADLLISLGWQVAGSLSPNSNRGNIAHLDREIKIVECDMRDRELLLAVIAQLTPDAIFHLAARTAERDTRTNPQLAFDVTAIGTVNLLDAVRSAGLARTRVLIAGSSAEYGRVESDDPIDEDHSLSPVTTYGVTKIAQSMVALQYHLAYDMPIVRTRAFNHTGPRQAEQFSTASFAKQIAEIEAGILPPVMHVGDLSQRRDLSDVRDVVNGYLLALTHGNAGEVYNIASGSAVRTGDVLDRMIAMSKVKIEVAVDSEKLRPAEVAVQVGDACKLRETAGWMPLIPLEKTLADTLEYWRRRTAGCQAVAR